MKTRILQALFATSLLATSAVLQAGLTIVNSSIVNDKYLYNLNYDKLDGLQFLNDVESYSNVVSRTEGNWRYVYATDTSANFVYKFDFSQTDFRPESVTISGGGYLFGDNTGNFAGTVSIYYRIGESATGNPDDGYVLLTSANNTFTGSTTSRSYNGGVQLSFSALSSLPETFYYKVVFNVTKGAVSNRYQWDRLNISTAGTNSGFTASFDMIAIPEPAAITLAFGGISILIATLCIRRHKR